MTGVTIPRLLVLCALFSSLAASGQSKAPPEPTSRRLNGAGCLVKIADRLLMVKDVWSRRYSLPGGGLAAAEPPPAAAAREIFEETGMKVEVGRLLERRGGFALFHCKLAEPDSLHAAASAMDPRLLRLRVPARSYNEIDQIILVNPKELAVGLWRFPSQREKVIALFTQVENQTLAITAEGPATPPSASESMGLGWIASLQTAGEGMRSVMAGLTFLGNEEFFYLAIPILILCVSPELGISLTFLLLLTIFLNGLLKAQISWPRPFDILPNLQLYASSGFGFPSGHAQATLVFWGYLAWRLRLPHLAKLAIGGIVFLIGLSRIYLGVHFPHDVLGGWFFGGLSLVAAYYLEPRFRAGRGMSRRGRLALGYTVGFLLLGLALWLRPHPESLAVVMVWFGFLLGLTFNQRRLAAWTRPRDLKSWLTRSLFGVGGLLAVVFMTKLATPSERTFLVMLIVAVLSYALMGLWLSWGEFLILKEKRSSL